MTEHTLFLYNPGIGDSSWLDRDIKLVEYLEKTFAPSTWALSVRQFGPPCGGYYYKLQFQGDDAAVRNKLKELKIRESVIAPLHFD